MRKIILLLFIAVLILFSCSQQNQNSETIKSTIQVDPEIGACNLRSKPEISEQSKILTQVYAGKEYDVIKTKPSYICVILTDKKLKKDFTGWLWIGTVDKKMTEVIGKGATLRKLPVKNNDNVIGFIWPGSKIKKVIGENVSWFQIKARGYIGWVHYSSIK